jgi:NADPH-dependent 2,4-dienoyl-CoA reductase/sulfur reductase-like enzyme/bacterioferritin-associated ferredoxin
MPVPSETAGGATLPETELTPDVLVVGGGPGGLSAARTIAAAGLDVLLIDERAKLGGQYFKQPPVPGTVDEERLDPQYREGRHLISAAREAGVQTLLGVHVWGAFSPHHLTAAGPNERFVIRPRRLVLAAGAYERGVPIPGWTLPGVMTTGAAQTLVRANQVAPGSRVLISGNGPLNLQLASEMTKAGVTVVGLAEVADIRWFAGLGPGAAMLLNVPSLVWRGMRYRATLLRHRVPLMPRSSVVAVSGGAVAEAATVARLDERGKTIPGTERTFDVDAVCLGFGFLPSNELSRALGCAHRYDTTTGQLVVERTSTGRTTVDTVWVVGDSAGVGGAQVAMAAGVIAARDILDSLGSRPDLLANEHAMAQRALRRHERFQRNLWRMYQAPILTDQLAMSDTVVCRCESVTLHELESALAEGPRTAGALKRMTRAGMGKCQGRYCSPVITTMASRNSGLPIDEFAGFAPQPPTRPTAITTIAAPEEPAEQP